MKRIVDLFKSKKQEKPSVEKSHQLLCEAFGRMLRYTREVRQGPYRINNDIWYG
nr:MAG TPA: hypothetical protein [Caudoviricetes sp.]